jgi:hypothetical protein
MEMFLGQQKSPDFSAELRASNELVKLIRKLRWMGRGDEAERMQMQLALCRVQPADSVLSALQQTD